MRSFVDIVKSRGYKIQTYGEVYSIYNESTPVFEVILKPTHVGGTAWLDITLGGWIYDCNADYIVFQEEHELIFISVQSLNLLLRHNLVDVEARNPDALYRLHGTKTLAKTEDLRSYSDFIWTY